MTNNTIKKIYVKEDKTINKFALFLSALAIALIALILVHFKEFTHIDRANAAELSVEEAKAELHQYVDSINGFTDSQREVLDSVIASYVNNKTVVQPEEMSEMYDVIHQNYQTNKEYVEDIKQELMGQLKSTSKSDDGHYQEINSMIDKLDTWAKQTDSDIVNLEKKIKTSNESPNQSINDLSRKQEEANDKINTSIKKLTDDISEKSKKADEDAANMKESVAKITNDLTTSKQKTESEKKQLESKIQKLSETIDANVKKSEADYISFNELIEEIKKYTDDSDSKLSTMVSQLTDDISSERELNKAEMENMNQRITDLQPKVNLGIEDNCYGYYVNGDEFKPF